MDLKTAYLYILGITTVTLIYTIFNIQVQTEGFFDVKKIITSPLGSLKKAVMTPLNAVASPITSLIDKFKWFLCVVLWIIKFMGWFVRSIVCLAKFANPICWICLSIDIVFSIFKYLAIFVASIFYISRKNIFREAEKSIDSLIAAIDKIYKIRYPTFIMKSCYWCSFESPPEMPKFPSPP